jgi:MFS family permease
MGVGVGEAGASPPSQALIADLFPHEQRGRAMGFFSSAVNLGMLIAFGMGGWIGAQYGWRAAFVAFFLFCVPPPFCFGPPPPPAPLLRSLREVTRYIAGERSLVHLMAGSTLAVLLSSALVLWLPVFFLRMHDVPQQTLGVEFGLMLGVIGAAGVLAIGFALDRFGARPERKPLLIAGIQLALCVAIEVVLYAPSYSESRVPLALVALLMNGFLGATFALTQDIVPDRFRALVPAVAVFLANLIGLGLGPYLFGAGSDLAEARFPGRGLQVALSVGFLLYVVSAAHYWRASVWLGRSREARAEG